MTLKTSELPNFFVVGAPKCGTTALHSYLGQHPDIFMPDEKEVHYFGSDLASLPATLDPQRHEALFERADTASQVGETCIWALYSKNAAREIKTAHPDAKIIISLRDPAQLIYALHSEYLYQGIEDIADLSRALDAEEDRRVGRRLPCRDLYPSAIYLYRRIASFADQVDRYFAEFSSSQIHVLIFEEFKRDPAAAYRNLLNFLNVDPSFSPQFPLVNVNKRVRSLLIQQWLHNPTRPEVQLFRRMFPFPKAKNRLAAFFSRWNVVRAPRQPLPSDLRKRLDAMFASDVSRLSQLLGRNLAAIWK